MPFPSKFLQLMSGMALGLALACGGGDKAPTTAENGGGNQSGTVTVLPPNYAGDIYWVAYQDGNGPWKVVNASGGQYTFTVTDPAGRYVLAFVDVTPGSPVPQWVEGSIYHFTRAEVSRIDMSSLSFLTTASVSGSVAGLLPADTASLKVRSRGTTIPAGGSSFSFTAFSGNQDLLAIRKAGGGVADRLVVSRNLPMAAGAVLPAIDFSTQGFALTPQMAGVSGGDPGDALTIYANWLTPMTSTTLAQASGTTLAFNALPSANHQVDETHFIGAQASQTATGKYAIAGRYTKSPVSVAITLPAKVSTPIFGTAITAPYYRPTLSWAPFPGALASWVLAADYTNYIFWDTTFSAGWLAGNTASSYTLPDFSPLAGWDNAWGLHPGSTLDWTFQNRWTSAPDAAFFVGTPRNHPEGETYWRSWMTLSTAAALQGGPALPRVAPRLGEPDGHRSRRSQDQERP